MIEEGGCMGCVKEETGSQEGVRIVPQAIMPFSTLENQQHVDRSCSAR